jgi:hypothetical protein
LAAAAERTGKPVSVRLVGPCLKLKVDRDESRLGDIGAVRTHLGRQPLVEHRREAAHRGEVGRAGRRLAEDAGVVSQEGVVLPQPESERDRIEGAAADPAGECAGCASRMGSASRGDDR